MNFNPFSLRDKTILVTGASSGIGRSIAIECSKMGAKLIITGRNEERLQDTLNSLEGDGHLSFKADLSNEQDCKTLVESVPVINGLVIAAGINFLLPFKFITEDKLKGLYDINFFSPVLLTQKLLKKKKLEKGTSIVTICSIDGPITTHLGNSVYSSSKAALLSMTKSMAVDLAYMKIRVNAILPGMTETPLINAGTLTEEQLKADMELYPLKRFAKPEEIAYASIYFLSDASSFTTGSSLVVDGGFSLL